MDDKIQMTEEQAKDIIKIAVPHAYAKWSLDQMKACGYIKKTNLEIYAESFYSLEPKDVKYGNCIDYIEALEKEVERLKETILKETIRIMIDERN